MIGIASEVLRPVLGWAYALYGLLLFGWLVWVGLALWRLGTAERRPGDRAGTEGPIGSHPDRAG